MANDIPLPYRIASKKDHERFVMFGQRHTLDLDDGRQEMVYYTLAGEVYVTSTESSLSGWGP